MTSHQSKMVHLLNKEPSISGSRRGDLPDASEAFTPSRYEQKDSEKRKTVSEHNSPYVRAVLTLLAYPKAPSLNFHGSPSPKGP